MALDPERHRDRAESRLAGVSYGRTGQYGLYRRNLDARPRHPESTMLRVSCRSRGLYCQSRGPFLFRLPQRRDPPGKPDLHTALHRLSPGTYGRSSAGDWRCTMHRLSRGSPGQNRRPESACSHSLFYGRPSGVFDAIRRHERSGRHTLQSFGSSEERSEEYRRPRDSCLFRLPPGWEWGAVAMGYFGSRRGAGARQALAGQASHGAGQLLRALLEVPSSHV